MDEWLGQILDPYHIRDGIVVDVRVFYIAMYVLDRRIRLRLVLDL